MGKTQLWSWNGWLNEAGYRRERFQALPKAWRKALLNAWKAGKSPNSIRSAGGIEAIAA